ncbi:MAG: sulfate reduction electron transfer complex DsrMKJOP subunit DsrO [Thermodesulfobacteriota bacterium]
MGMDRRDFLKIAALAAGLGVKPAADLVLGGFEAQAQTQPAQAVLAQAKKWAMVVDMTKLTAEDCKAAIKACHDAHNVPDVRTADGQVDVKHEVKWLWTDKYENVFPDDYNAVIPPAMEKKDFLVLCNHCTDPPCVRVCPTQATFKRPDGIVVMDMHRCIGCRFCMAGCPFGSRSFNWSDPRPFIKKVNPEYPRRMKGVVEKCNFCDERLAKGLYPACVEACRSGALTFGDLDTPSSPVRQVLAKRYAIRRKPGLGTGPNVFYVI